MLISKEDAVQADLNMLPKTVEVGIELFKYILMLYISFVRV